MFTLGFTKQAGIMPNFFRPAAAAGTAAKVTTAVATSKAARLASSAPSAVARSAAGYKPPSVKSTSEIIKHMPNAQQGRVERGIAASKGTPVVDKGSQYGKAQKKQVAAAGAPKPAPAPAAPGLNAAKTHFDKYKGHYAAGAAGLAAGSMLSGKDN